MQPKTSPLVTDVRSASRNLVRQLGIINRTVAGTKFSASAVHAIFEIGQAGELSSKDLSERLILEKSTISRLVRTLVEKGEICELRSKDDGRVKHLSLTSKGRQTLNAINNFAQKQVSSALNQLDERTQHGILKGLRDYSRALEASTNSQDRQKLVNQITIKNGYTPALIGRVVEMFISYMNKALGFGAAFESKVAAGLAEFMSRIDSPNNDIWRAEIDGKIVGSIAIDGENLEEGVAHLRWFIASDDIRGGGVGKLLLTQALEFCDSQGYRETHLWTVKGLDAARKLYEKHGFALAEEYSGTQWGRDVREQKFVRIRSK